MHCAFGVGSKFRSPTTGGFLSIENEHKNVGPWVLGTLSFHHSHVTFFFSLPNDFFFQMDMSDIPNCCVNWKNDDKTHGVCFSPFHHYSLPDQA